ncbi:MAG: MMPL family transporter, partial [Clostridium sp.]|nr:MMPL family transporter [Clostridium sp.]
MIKFGKFIAKHCRLILLICILLIIPSTYGIVKTRINYDVLSYLPDTLETVDGQNILLDEFGMGAFSMIVVEDMSMKDVQQLEETVEAIDHVKDVLWYDDALDINVPTEMLPNELHDALFHGNATMMIALFDDGTSSDATMDTITAIRKVVNKQCYVSGMSSVVTDIKSLFQQEMPIYVAIAAILCLFVLCLTMNSLLVPVLFLSSIGMAILYNLGSNIFIGEISYITQALTAILQLGVTTDYSIFLLNSYEENKKRYPGDNNRAMAHAISNTFKSVAGSSITTIAGFVALCFMSFTLGRDIGVVMAKGVVLGVICCITLLPSLILICDKGIEKTTHRPIIGSLDGVSKFITKHYLAFFLGFILLLVPAIYGNNHVNVYYKIDESLPQDLESAIANKKLDETFNMNSVHMVLLKNGLSANEKSTLLDNLNDVKGVKWALGLNSLIGSNFPDNMLTSDVTAKLKSDNYELIFVCSNYKTATN